MEGSHGVLTPRSEKAYNRIHQEFDLVSQQLSLGQDQVRQALQYGFPTSEIKHIVPHETNTFVELDFRPKDLKHVRIRFAKRLRGTHPGKKRRIELETNF